MSYQTIADATNGSVSDLVKASEAIDKEIKFDTDKADYRTVLRKRFELVAADI
jgi:hypothetical protein